MGLSVGNLLWKVRVRSRDSPKDVLFEFTLPAVPWPACWPPSATNPQEHCFFFVDAAMPSVPPATSPPLQPSLPTPRLCSMFLWARHRETSPSVANSITVKASGADASDMPVPIWTWNSQGTTTAPPNPQLKRRPRSA